RIADYVCAPERTPKLASFGIGTCRRGSVLATLASESALVLAVLRLFLGELLIHGGCGLGLDPEVVQAAASGIEADRSLDAHAVIRAPAHIACAAKILPAGIERLDVLGVVLFFGVLRPLLHLLADMRLVLEVVLAGIKNILVGDFNGSGFFVGIIYARHNAMVPILAAFAALRCLKVGRHQSIIAGTAVWTLGLLLGSDASLRGFLAVELLVRLHLRLPHVRMVLLVIVAFRTRLAPEFFRFLGGVGRAHGGFPDHLVFRQASLEELVLFPFHLDRTHLGVRITFFEERGVLLALGRLQLWIG